MNYFLLVYDRSTGRLLRAPREYPSAQRDAAMRERFALELENRERPEVEVVVLGADSLEDLQRTHSRYFRTVEEIASGKTR